MTKDKIRIPKKKYTSPKISDLNLVGDVYGLGICLSGISASDDCSTGGVAAMTCGAGGSADCGVGGSPV